MYDEAMIEFYDHPSKQLQYATYRYRHSQVRSQESYPKTLLITAANVLPTLHEYCSNFGQANEVRTGNVLPASISKTEDVLSSCERCKNVQKS